MFPTFLIHGTTLNNLHLSEFDSSAFVIIFSISLIITGSNNFTGFDTHSVASFQIDTKLNKTIPLIENNMKLHVSVRNGSADPTYSASKFDLGTIFWPGFGKGKNI